MGGACLTSLALTLLRTPCVSAVSPPAFSDLPPHFLRARWVKSL
jgi:hypothetical protein